MVGTSGAAPRHETVADLAGTWSYKEGKEELFLRIRENGKCSMWQVREGGIQGMRSGGTVARDGQFVSVAFGDKALDFEQDKDRLKYFEPSSGKWYEMTKSSTGDDPPPVAQPRGSTLPEPDSGQKLKTVFRHIVAEPRKRIAAFVIRIDAAGAASVSGEKLAGKTLDDRLADAGRKAGFDKSNTVSKLKVVIRADAKAPYSAIQRAMLACVNARIANILLAVGDGKPIPTPLPKDPGASSTQKTPEKRIETRQLEVRVRLFRKQPGGPVLCELPVKGVGGIPFEEALELVPKMKDTWKDARIVIFADANMPFEAVASVLGACSRAGLTNIVFGASKARPAK
jgi:biopolymer transport protein ExbD